MGTPDFALPALKALIAHHELVGVVTQPDRPAGRSKTPQFSPVKNTALAHGIPVFQPEKIRRAEAITDLERWQADVYIVAAFGQILPQTVLDIPEYGSLNIHGSLLPRWRGAAPIQAAVRAGDAQSGITIMKMDAGLDTGPILSQRAVTLAPDETAASLHDRLAVLGAELLIETLPAYIEGRIQPQPQEDSQATYAPTLKKEEGRIDWSLPATQIERQIRAFTPWPGSFSTWDGQQIKILAAGVVPGKADPGQVVAYEEAVAVGTGEALLALTRLQMAGRKAMSVTDFLRGNQHFSHSQLGT
jgi:methionyl-tRNA formyltransferase